MERATMTELILTCYGCLGKFSGAANHTHQSNGIVDERFADCRICHGRGAVTCEVCQGTGRLVKQDDGTLIPAFGFAQEMRCRSQQWLAEELSRDRLRRAGKPLPPRVKKGGPSST
jgi:DnaJ-class molecular chaperone